MKRFLALALLAPLLGGCFQTLGGSVAGGECKFLERPAYAVRGVRQYDQDWIDRTVEGGVGACKWARPAARPAELDAVQPKAKPVAKAHKPAKHGILWRMRDAWQKRKHVAAPAPEAPAPSPSLTPLPAEPAAPAPRSAIDELLSPAPWAKP